METDAGLENAAIDEIRVFLNETANDYKTDRLIGFIEEEEEINDKFYLPRRVKNGFYDFWHTLPEDYLKKHSLLFLANKMILF
jgi:hypothetical protein